MDLKSFFEQTPKLAVAFSGGTDSAYLLHEAKRHNIVVEAFYAKSCFQPEFELVDAQRFCYEQGIKLHIIAVDILNIPKVKNNSERRCYYCKYAIFSTLCKVALENGFTVMADGTNASDIVTDRPGMMALEELSVVSPLRLCGLTKSEIRRRSEQAHLFTANKPAYACLATRVPTGTCITEELLDQVEKGEQYLMTLGFTDFRLRILPPETALLQVTENQLSLLLEQREKIQMGLSDYFDQTYLDLNPRKPSDGLKILKPRTAAPEHAVEKTSQEVSEWNPKLFETF